MLPKNAERGKKCALIEVLNSKISCFYCVSFFLFIVSISNEGFEYAGELNID
jgi:hypothetical protein